MPDLSPGCVGRKEVACYPLKYAAAIYKSTLGSVCVVFVVCVTNDENKKSHI